MVNIILTIIVAYYLIRTGDIFKIIRKIRMWVNQFLEKTQQDNDLANEENPLSILKLRYAKGEISGKEFEQMRGNL